MHVNMQNYVFLFLHAASQKELYSFIFMLSYPCLACCLLHSKDLVLNLWKTREQQLHV